MANPLLPKGCWGMGNGEATGAGCRLLVMGMLSVDSLKGSVDKALPGEKAIAFWGEY